MLDVDYLCSAAFRCDESGRILLTEKDTHYLSISRSYTNTRNAQTVLVVDVRFQAHNPYSLNHQICSLYSCQLMVKRCRYIFINIMRYCAAQLYTYAAQMNCVIIVVKPRVYYSVK